jgi:hypothetical protein
MGRIDAITMSSKFEEVVLTRCFVSRLMSSFWQLQMFELFMWRCCGLGFLALHKVQFSVEFFICTSINGLNFLVFLIVVRGVNDPFGTKGVFLLSSRSECLILEATNSDRLL